MKASEIDERIARGEACPVCGATWRMHQKMDGDTMRSVIQLKHEPDCAWHNRDDHLPFDYEFVTQADFDNDEQVQLAMQVIRDESGGNIDYVFTWRGRQMLTTLASARLRVGLHHRKANR
jgi:hypothetical protein